MPGRDEVPDGIFSGAVMVVTPFEATEPVSAVPASVKLVFTAVDEIVVPLLNEFGTE
jgi:Na+-translocating ferredoxin:NAD+ oxidoreductase RnfD subunit